MSDPFERIDRSTGGGSGSGNGEPPAFVPVTPIPADAPPRPTSNPKVGVPSTTWCYRDATGAPLGYAHRFDGPDGKQFRPQVLFRNVATGAMAWRWVSWDAPRPLYGLDRLAARPDAPVILCEGEKAADAAAQLAPDHVTVTSPNGSKSAGKADWSPLAGRRVTVWPDADDAGHDYGKAVVKLLREAGAAGVVVLAAPEGSAEGWDAADALAERWTIDRTAELLRSARAPLKAVSGGSGGAKAKGRQDAPENDDEDAADSSRGNGGRRRPARDVLMDITEPCRFWAGTDAECYVTFPRNGHFENWPVKSRDFRRWLRGEAHLKTGSVPGGQAIEDVLAVSEAIATRGDARRDPWFRVGRLGEKLHVDLCDAGWRAVEIGPKGWAVLDRHALPFVRADAMKPIPEPEAGYAIEELRRFLNVETDADFVLVVAWLLMAIRPDGPYPIMVINGEQGSGKSTFSRLLRSLIDPNLSPIRAAPVDERDLFVMAANSHCPVFDNISKVENWLSDALCRIATGGGYSTRMLHSDRGEIVFDITRPMILNGIPSLTDRPDLAERSIKVSLCAIDEDHRRPEKDFWSDWEAVRPRVLGALYDAVSRGLAGLDAVRLPTLPRMADFACWAVACEPGLGWEAGTFLAAYDHNRKDMTEGSFEADPVAVAIRALMTMEAHQNGWTGSATDLVMALTGHVSPSMAKSRSWPQTAQGLGNRIDRVKPLLRAKGLQIERKHSGTRSVTITWRPL